MAKRATIIIDDAINKKLRILQAKRNEKSSSYVSFSKILNEQLRKILK